MAATLESIAALQEARGVQVRSVAGELALLGEFFCGDVWRSWSHPGLTKRQGVPVIRQVLDAMVREGSLRSWLVSPAEHGQGQWFRRYYAGVP